MEHYKGLKMACTVVCLNSFSGEVPSSKIVLVGILFENRLRKSHHAYAVLDDKSNAFIISPDLANNQGVFTWENSHRREFHTAMTV